MDADTWIQQASGIPPFADTVAADFEASAVRLRAAGTLSAKGIANTLAEGFPRESGRLAERRDAVIYPATDELNRLVELRLTAVVQPLDVVGTIKSEAMLDRLLAMDSDHRIEVILAAFESGRNPSIVSAVFNADDAIITELGLRRGEIRQDGTDLIQQPNLYDALREAFASRTNPEVTRQIDELRSAITVATRALISAEKRLRAVVGIGGTGIKLNAVGNPQAAAEAA